jgi:hypothetical protein
VTPVAKPRRHGRKAATRAAQSIVAPCNAIYLHQQPRVSTMVRARIDNVKSPVAQVHFVYYNLRHCLRYKAGNILKGGKPDCAKDRRRIEGHGAPHPVPSIHRHIGGSQYVAYIPYSTPRIAVHSNIVPQQSSSSHPPSSSPDTSCSKRQSITYGRNSNPSCGRCNNGRILGHRVRVRSRAGLRHPLLKM